MKKICSKCLEEKDIEHFNKRKKSSDGCSPACKTCHATWNKQHYKNNPVPYKNRATEQRKVLSEFIRSIKEKGRCEKCEQHEGKWWRLDFHHPDPSIKREILLS